MRTWFVLVMMAVVALSGCAGEDAGFEPTSDPIDDGAGGNETVDSVDSGDAGATAENGTEAAENLVPALTFTADVVNGTAPLLVNFTIDADDDSEELTWRLFIDGNETYTGTEVPSVVNHTFEEGVYNVTLVLSDGEHEVEETLSFDVASGVEESTLLASYEQTALIAGAYTSKGSPKNADQCPGFRLGNEDQGCVILPYDAALAGGTAAFTTTAANLRIAFWDTCSIDGTGIGWAEADGKTVNAELPAGAGCVVVWSSNLLDWGSDATLTMDVYNFIE